MSARSLSRFLLVMLVFGAMIAAAGCNTMSGMGRDISSAGNSMENAAEKNK